MDWEESSDLKYLQKSEIISILINQSIKSGNIDKMHSQSSQTPLQKIRDGPTEVQSPQTPEKSRISSELTLSEPNQAHRWNGSAAEAELSSSCKRRENNSSQQSWRQFETMGVEGSPMMQWMKGSKRVAVKSGNAEAIGSDCLFRPGLPPEPTIEKHSRRPIWATQHLEHSHTVIRIENTHPAHYRWPCTKNGQYSMGVYSIISYKSGLLYNKCRNAL